jgi:hypothetical protein
MTKLYILLSLFAFSFAQAQVVVDDATLKILFDYTLQETKQTSANNVQLLQDLSVNPTLRANAEWLKVQIGDPKRFAVLHEYENAKNVGDLEFVAEKRHPVYVQSGFYLSDHPTDSAGKHFILGHSKDTFVMLSVYRPTGMSVFGPEATIGKINISVAYKIEDFTEFEKLSPEQEKIGRMALKDVNAQDMDRHVEEQLMRFKDVDLFSEFFDSKSKLYVALLFRDYLDEYHKSIDSSRPTHPYTRNLGQFPQLSFFNAVNGDQHLILTSEVIAPHLTADYLPLLRDFLNLPKALLANLFRSYHKIESASGAPACIPFSKYFN